MSDWIDWTSDILDDDVQDELEVRFERTLKPLASADGVDLGDYKQVSEWVRQRYEAGDPDVRDAIAFVSVQHSFSSFHEPPYYWGCIRSVCHLVEGRAEPVGDAAIRDFQQSNGELCADMVLEDGVDIYEEEPIRAWVRQRYDAGDATVRRGLLAEAAWKALHDFELGYREAPLAGCEEYFAPDEIMGTFWDRGAYRDRPDDDGEDDRDPQWELDNYHFLGRFTSMGNVYEVFDHEEGGDDPPHFYLRRPKSPRGHGVYVGMFEPVYVDLGRGRVGLSEREIADFVEFLEGSNVYDFGRADYGMPDYTKLHWPDEG